MAHKVLILSSQEDVHATRVQQKLGALGVEVRFWNFDPFVSDCDLEFVISNDNNNFALQLADGPIELRCFDSIWYRRPGALKSKSFFEPWVADLMLQESRQGLMGMLNAIPSLWVNHPVRDKNCSLKLFQLQVAKNAGMFVPETIVTNSPETACDFFEKHSGNVIYKLITEKSNFSLPRYEFPHGVPTLPLREADLIHLDQVRHGPHLFQERVQKKADVRVTVIGAKPFATYIESQVGAGKLDWRNDYSVPMLTHELPDDVAHKCLKVLKLLGLNFGAFDFCFDHEGRYVFLEVNSAGQYLWVEERTQQPLTEEVALLLAGKSAPLTSYDAAAFCD
ncbi:MAG TPA: hypothetical protein V6C76_14515 [Drouetiella sp.]